MSTASLASRARSAASGLMSPVNAVIMAKLLVELESEKMAKLDAELLDFMDVRDADGTRITDPAKDFYMAEHYAKPYYAERDKRLKEMGYDLEPGYCPALIAKNLLNKAERVLLEMGGEYVPGLDADRLICAGLDKYQEAIDLLCKLVVNAPGYRPPALPRQ